MTRTLSALRVELLVARGVPRRRAQAEVARAIRRGRVAAKSPLTLQAMVTQLAYARMDREARS
jgi:hypothetical protein